MDTGKITRFEVIDHTDAAKKEGKQGRILTLVGAKVDVSIQDDGRTMKVFLSDLPSE